MYVGETGDCQHNVTPRMFLLYLFTQHMHLLNALIMSDATFMGQANMNIDFQVYVIKIRRGGACSWGRGD